MKYLPFIALAAMLGTTCGNAQEQVEHTPAGLKHLYARCLDMPKDSLRALFSAFPDSLQKTGYGAVITEYLDTSSIAEGDRYYDFSATTDSGKAFTLSSLAGKNILFIGGGLYCMQQDARDYLNALYDRTSRNDFEIVVYIPCNTMDDLQKRRKKFPCKFFIVSDFLGNTSPIFTQHYTCVVRPTCYFIDKKGIVQMRSMGLFPNKIDEMVNSVNNE
jgi:hypothetical protein